MELTWERGRGWCEGREIGQVYERAGGWEGCVAHVPVPGGLRATLEEAQIAVDAVVAGRPLPEVREVRERRRWVPNTGPCETPG